MQNSTTPDTQTGAANLRPMNTESLELQYQGFRLINTLLSNEPGYFQEHNDIVRAFRWLWRSKGRFLRLQHEDLVSPRYHGESSILASFLMAYARSFPNEDLDILFELIRIFLQPSASEFTFVGQFLAKTVSVVLTVSQKKQVIRRFFSLIAGESTEETKVLSIQFLIFPMLQTASPSRSVSTETASHVASGESSKPSEASRVASGESSEPSESFIDASVVEKFTNEVMYHQGAPINCGVRLKIELLKLLKVFVVSNPKLVEPHRKEMVRFCWGLLKSDDATCKGWAYLVVSCFVEAFETPAKIIVQVYIALLRSHQQEGKELVRNALGVLVPILPVRLPDDEFKKIVEQTSQLMLEEGNSTPQLAHICQTIVHSPNIFYGSRTRFVGYMINSLNRLGLPPNCPLENRVLAVDIVSVLLDWESKKGPMEASVVPTDQIDVVGNFLVRLKILMAEPSDGKHQKVEVSGVPSLEARVVELFDRVLTRWDVLVRPTPFEKASSRDQNSDGLLLSCLELLGVMAKTERYTFFSKHQSLLRDIIVSGFRQAKDNPGLRTGLRAFVERAREVDSLGPMMMNALERIVIEATAEQKKKPPGRASDPDPQGSVRSTRDRPGGPGGSEDSTSESFEVFALELISKMCKTRRSYLKLISTSLLSLGTALMKIHLSEAAAKQRQGSPSAPRTASPGNMCHTPTCGILEAAFRNDGRNGPKSVPTKLRSTKDAVISGSSSTVRALVEILTIFEASDLPFLFSTSRKILYQIISSLLDSSDSVQVLVVAMRIAGKWILVDCTGTPVTLKERNSILWKISALDYAGITNDLEAQPLADTASLLITRYIALQPNLRDAESGRCLIASLLHADLEVRNIIWDHFAKGEKITIALFWQVLHADLEGLGGRFWIAILVDALLLSLTGQDADSIKPLRALIHGDPLLCMELFESLLQAAWEHVPTNSLRLKLARSFEFLLSRPYHAQFLGNSDSLVDKRCSNAVRAFLNGLLHVQPIPLLDMQLLVSTAESYSCWHEVLFLLESQYYTMKAESAGETTLAAMRHCYRKLDEEGIWMGLAAQSCKLPQSLRVLSKDVYGMVNEAVEGYANLVDLVEADDSQLEASDFEMDLWEERWVDLHKDLCQLQVVAEYASATGSPHLLLECAWKTQDWNKVRSLCASSALLSAVENGDPLVKMSETLLAVADGKLGDVENLHAQTAQLCLYKWQLLPGLCSGSLAHSSLFQFFHRLVEIRESGQIMVETSNHSSGRTLPDLKNLLNAWRHRLPNNWDRLSVWDEVFGWRTHMFTAITSNFAWSEAVVELHDRPWTMIRMAKAARTQGMRDVSLLLLNKTAEERAMSVSDAFLKLREQILAYYNRDSELERHGGLNLINTTNLSFFDASQKSELFRLKAMFLASLGGRSKANQTYCHSVQICATHARAWNSWGELCASLGAVAEKQANDGSTTASGDAAAVQEAKASAAKKISQYLAQAMGCYLEAVQLDGHEWARIHIPKCLWMLNKDGPSHGVLCKTLEDRGSLIPAWVWLPWIPQLLTSFYRTEGRAIKAIFSQLVRAYPQAVYYPLRSFYLERRDVERARNASSSSSSGQNMGSVSIAEVMMSLLRRSHASLWSALESVLEELIVKFRPSYEEELLSTLISLLERVETQVGSIGKADDEDGVIAPVWKTLGRIAVKFFRPTDPGSAMQDDERAKKTADFKIVFKESFERDFDVKSDADPSSVSEGKPSFALKELLERLRSWKGKLETHVLSSPQSISLVEASQALAMFGVGDAPELWPGSCDPEYFGSKRDREPTADEDAGSTTSSTSSSAAAARKAANIAAATTAAAAAKEGIGGEYGGGSSRIEVPGQYAPNTCAWADILPSPELHAKLVKFVPSVEVLRRNDQLVRRIGMIASDGRTYRFLLQFAVPYWTRTDERTSQLHYVLDKVIRKDVGSARAHLSVQPQPVIPVAQRLRLTHEPDGSMSLEEVYRNHCTKKGKDHSALAHRYRDELKQLLADLAEDDSIDAAGRQEAENAGKLALFKKISLAEGAEPCILSDYLRSSLKGPEPFYQFRRTFAQQWGANCLLQYVLSVVERTPARVAFVEENGRVLAPDFRIAYSSQGFIESQTIPFRLTPNIVNLIGFSLLDACFVTSMARIATAVRTYRNDIDPILRLLMRDDLVTFYTKSMAKSDSQTQEMEKQLTDRVSRNVATLHSRFAECCPTYNQPTTDPVDQRVRDLIATARSPKVLSNMPINFHGWI
jgi:hypothetical protein